MNISDLPATPFGVPMNPPGAAVLPPLTRQRVAQSLTRLGINFALDEDGDPVSLWDGFILRTICTGEKLEVLQARAVWAAQPPREKRGQLLEWFNAWHDSHRWPQLFIHDEGDLQIVVADVTTDLEHGVSDAQLDQLLRCAAGTAQPAFAELAEAFPEFPEWAPKGADDGAQG